jgi:heat shock protein HtpX
MARRFATHPSIAERIERLAGLNAGTVSVDMPLPPPPGRGGSDDPPSSPPPTTPPPGGPLGGHGIPGIPGLPGWPPDGAGR